MGFECRLVFIMCFFVVRDRQPPSLCSFSTRAPSTLSNLSAVAHPTGMLALQVEAAVRHALQEAARRSEGSFHRGSGNVVGAAGDSVHSNGSAGDSVRDGMSFRQVGVAECVV